MISEIYRNLEKIDVIRSISINAGKAILEVYNTDFNVEYKSDSSPLTLADKRANEIIVSGLRENYRDIAILSEELKDDRTRMQNDFCFIVDPLDGTKEFVKKNGEFSVNIALTYKKRPIMGAVYVPVTDEFYYAERDRGAFYEDIKSGEVKKIKVSDRLDNLIFLQSKSHSKDKEKSLIENNKDKIAKIISFGSSIKGCMVASAKADLYYRYGYTSEWDTCAMQCIIEEAGGILRQMDGSEMLYNRENTLNEKGFYIVNRKENIWV